MKIALFTDSFLPGIGGTEKAVLGLANAFTEMGEEVIVCCPAFNHHDDSVFNFPVLRCASIKVTSNDVCGFPAASRKFKKRLKEFAPDIIHCQTVSPMTAYAFKYAKKAANKPPVIMTVHTKFKTAWERSIHSKVIVNGFVKNLRKKLLKTDKVYTVSNDMIAELNSYGYNGDITVVRNGAMFERIENLEQTKQLAIEKYNLQNEENILLFVGHIVKFKNLQFTLDALKLVKEEIPSFKILLVGRGQDDAYFRKYAREQGLGDNALFTGEITDKALLSSLYSVGELFLFPSIFDNDPLTVVEAATHRVPALTLKNTGASERITDNVSGYIVDNDVRAYADKIIYLLRHKDELKQAGVNAEKMIPKDWRQTAEEYLAEYKKLLKDKTT